MNKPQGDYVKVGREWPLWVSPSDVSRAQESGVPVSVYPDGVDMTVLGEGSLARDVGYVGIPLVGGQIDMDANSTLTSYAWRGSYDDLGIVDQMVREDPVAQAIRLAWTLPLLSVQWSVQPGSDDPKDVEIAEFVQSVFFEHMRGGWDDFLEQAVQFTWRGLSAFEIIARYDKELGATVIDQLAPRLPWTIYQWQKYPDGRYGFIQWPDQADPPVGTQPNRGFDKEPVLPPDKIILFRFQPEGDNPEPMGILRPSYGAWRQRRTYLKLEATGYERSAYGIPTVTVEPGANPGDVSQVNIILRELRAGIRSFAMFPKGFNLEWTECPMKADAIRQARVAAGQDMARAALCQFLFTGESAGAYSLIQGQLDHYTMALQQAANSIATTLSQGPHALVKRLVNWNYPGVTTYPYIQAGEIRVGDPKQLVEAVKSAVDAGVVTPDALIEAKVRDVLSLPQRLDSSAKPIDIDPSASDTPEEPEEEPTEPPDAPPKASSRGEEQAKREVEDVEEAVSEHSCEHHVALAATPAEDRVVEDAFVEGPRGREMRAAETCVRYSEVTGVKDEANRAMADTITDWRAEVTPAYADLLAAEETVEDMLSVEVPMQRELEDRLVDELREVYESAKAAVEREFERQKADPELRRDVQEGDVEPRVVDGQIELFDGECLADPVSPPSPVGGESPSPVDDIDPEESIRSTAAATTRNAADRVQRTSIATVQAAGIGGTPPPSTAVVAAVTETLLGLSAGVDFREAQQASNTTYGLGRMQELRGTEVREYLYSNLAESQSCSACAERDGDTFGSDQLAEYSTPAAWCEGLNMCNCLILGIVK